MTDNTNVGFQGPYPAATSGILVERRARFVDLLENLLSAGQQEAILAATLDAASLGPGDHALDVGCGSGKLVVAAARTSGQAESRSALMRRPQ